MKNIWIFLYFFSMSLSVQADEYLIQEMESLKESLSDEDPDRLTLTLRLADLYFDVSIQEGTDQKIVANRLKALKLYEDVLLGREHLQKVSGDKAIIIKFQIARVLTKLYRNDEAKNYYLEVFLTKEVDKKIRREASFSLAEYYEEKVNFSYSDKYYLSAIELCESVESCNYAHYKRAWLYYKEVKLVTAIAELKLSLFERDGSVREKVLNDLLLFFSANSTDGEKELTYILELEKKLKRNDLVKKLVEAFYSAGNRIAGTKTLIALNKRSPDIFYEARLIEEFYGYKDLELMTRYLNLLTKRTDKDIPKLEAEAVEFKAMLKRILVQLDSESQSNKAYSSPLQKMIEQYLVFYKNDDMRVKLQQGWLKVEDDLIKKIDRLGLWIKEDIAFNLPSAHVIQLRESRLSFAMKLKKNDIVLEEGLALANSDLNENKRREYKYILAHELYKIKNFTKAVPLFKELSLLADENVRENSIDKWAIQSQQLLLDIYNIQKDYISLIAQASTWIDIKALSENKSLKTDLSAIKLIKDQAKFEYAVSLGETNQSLEKFYQYCFEKLFEKKSCDNAKILSVKLKDQTKLVALLEKAQDEKALMYEYEAMGEFFKSAVLYEKYLLGSKAQTSDYLKVSLLYEFSGQLQDRDRILTNLVNEIRKNKEFEPNTENAVYATLDEAKLLNNKTLLLPWSTAKKISLAQRLSITNPDKTNMDIIKKQMTYSGSSWAKYILSSVQKLYEKQRKISFYGQNSKYLFKKRLKYLNEEVSLAKSYLEGADTQTRIYLLDMLKKSYGHLANEILATPLPGGLTEDVLVQVKEKLSTMADPYFKIELEYLDLQNVELTRMDIASQEKIKRIAEIKNKEIEYPGLIKEDTFLEIENRNLDYVSFNQQLSILKIKPYDSTQLINIEKYLNENNQTRMASYFAGRIQSLKEMNRE